MRVIENQVMERIDPTKYLLSQEKEFDDCMLLDSWFDFDSGKVVLQFYDVKNQRIVGSLEKPEHYLLNRNPSKKDIEKKVADIDGFKRVEVIELMDLLDMEMKEFTKIIGATSDIVKDRKGANFFRRLPDSLEVKIKPYLRLILDSQMIPGTYYQRVGGKLLPKEHALEENVMKEVDKLVSGKDEDYKQVFLQWMKVLTPSVPKFKMLAMDLEVLSKPDIFPDASEAKEKILSAAFVTSDGRNEVLINGEIKFKEQGDNKSIPEKLVVKVYKDERSLIRAIFKEFWEYPIVLSYNGDMFDMRYIQNRAMRLRIDDESPIITMKGIGQSDFTTRLKSTIHLDLFQFFRNKAIQNHGFKGAYTENSLDAVAKGLLNEGKVGKGGNVSEMSFQDLIYYNWKDAELTFRLMTFNSGIATSLLIMMMRITKLPATELTRVWLSAWGKQLLFWEHKRRKCVIPNTAEIQASKSTFHTKAKTGDSKYEGGFVITPKPGVYFDVVVMDFSSLYPSIIKEYNLSYESVDCKHLECKKNTIPGTPHWYCGNWIGIASGVIRIIRDVRVMYFKDKANDKSLSEELRAFFNSIQAALKVIMNSAYGMFGSDKFILYCLPVADSTTAVGRDAVKKVAKKAIDAAVPVLYGDTDSNFLHKPSKAFLGELIDWTQKTLRLELAVDKEYKFLALSTRKKNYLGIYANGKVDIKGMVGKKSNTPTFIQRAFKEVIEIIKSVKDESDFPRVKEEIKKLVYGYLVKMKKGKLPIEDYEIRVKLNKDSVESILDRNKSVTAQHMVAAREMLALKKIELSAGQGLSFVKVKSGARLTALASLKELNKKKYEEMLKSAFEQVLDALQMPFPDGNTRLDAFF